MVFKSFFPYVESVAVETPTLKKSGIHIIIVDNYVTMPMLEARHQIALPISQNPILSLDHNIVTPVDETTSIFAIGSTSVGDPPP